MLQCRPKRVCLLYQKSRRATKRIDITTASQKKTQRLLPLILYMEPIQLILMILQYDIIHMGYTLH